MLILVHNVLIMLRALRFKVDPGTHTSDPGTRSALQA